MSVKSHAEDTYQSVKLTKSVCERAKPTRDQHGNVRPKIYRDTIEKGFGLRVGESAKTFFYQGRVRGRPVQVTIDRFGNLTVEQARTRAAELRVKMAGGVNPNEEKERLRTAGLTLGEAWLDYRKNIASDRAHAERTLKRYAYCIEHYLADWVRRPLDALTKRDLVERHRKLRDDIQKGVYAPVIKHPEFYGKRKGERRTHRDRNGLHTANEVFRVVRAIVNHAVDNDGTLRVRLSEQNVHWRKFPWFSEKTEGFQRPSTAIPPEQLKDWYTGVQKIENEVRRDFWRWALFTGLRRESIAVMRWGHVDEGKRLLHIPKPKGGSWKAFDLPLTDFHLQLLRQRRKANSVFAPDSEWVFPSLTSKSGHIAEPKTAIAEATYERNGTERHYTLHDCRRTFATQAELYAGVPHRLVGDLLNHARPRNDVTSGYVQSDVDARRDAMQRITERLLSLVGETIARPAPRTSKRAGSSVKERSAA